MTLLYPHYIHYICFLGKIKHWCSHRCFQPCFETVVRHLPIALKGVRKIRGAIHLGGLMKKDMCVCVHCAYFYLFLYSLIRSFIRLFFIHSCIHSLIHLSFWFTSISMCGCIYVCICVIITFAYWFTVLLNCSSICICIYLYVYKMHLFVYLFTYLHTYWCIYIRYICVCAFHSLTYLSIDLSTIDIDSFMCLFIHLQYPFS